MENNLPLYQQALNLLTQCRSKWNACSTNSFREVEALQKIQALCEDISLLETPQHEDEDDVDNETEINHALFVRARM